MTKTRKEFGIVGPFPDMHGMHFSLLHTAIHFKDLKLLYFKGFAAAVLAKGLCKSDTRTSWLLPSMQAPAPGPSPCLAIDMNCKACGGTQCTDCNYPFELASNQCGVCCLHHVTSRGHSSSTQDHGCAMLRVHVLCLLRESVMQHCLYVQAFAIPRMT